MVGGGSVVAAPADFKVCAERGEKARLLIISNIPPSNISPVTVDSNSGKEKGVNRSAVGLDLEVNPVSKPKPRARKKKRPQTTNRKHITKASSITHEGKEYRINNGKGEKKYGLYAPILHEMIDQYQIAFKKWQRVLVLRVELHMPHETDNNRVVSLFLKRLKKQLKQKYGFRDIGHTWAREYHGKGKGQHYHLALFLDGNKVRHPSRINEIIKASWERKSGDCHGGYSIGYIKRPFYFVNNGEIEQAAIYRVSYLAKTRGKGNRPSQTKDYQCSRMKV